MIPVFLRDLMPRMVLVALVGLIFFRIEPGFHQHAGEAMTPDTFDLALGPLGISASLANLAGLAMLILLAGFISGDRRLGYHRLYFSHPTRPSVFYLVRWTMALALALLAAAVFLVLGQVAAWGEFQGGWAGMQMALLAAVAYGGLLAFLSSVLRRGDAWVALLLFLFNVVWGEASGMGMEPFPPAIRDVLSLLLPPQIPLQDVYDGLLRGETAWPAVAFVAGYGIFWLLLAMLVVETREWP